MCIKPNDYNINRFCLIYEYKRKVYVVFRRRRVPKTDKTQAAVRACRITKKTHKINLIRNYLGQRKEEAGKRKGEIKKS